jgi:nitrate reductase beta subunit
MACKSTWTFSKGQEHMWWTNVETKPYGGHPQAWDVKALALLEENSPGGRWTPKPSAGKPYGVYEGKTLFEPTPALARPEQVLGYLPTDDEYRHPNIHEDTAPGQARGAAGDPFKSGETLPVHKTWFFYLARLCNHCSFPACLAACPRKAIYKRPEDGIVLVDQRECRGYRKCVAACPYKKVYYRPSTRIAEKCIGCYPRIEGKDQDAPGVPLETRCMSACIGQMRLQGLVRMDPDATLAEDRQNPVYYLVHVARVALPLYPQFGTAPNGYYIPPRWVPRAYLRQMFGPGVDEALERYRYPDRELLAVLQLFRRSNRMIFSYRIEPGPKVYERDVGGKLFEMFNDTIIALGREGQELFRTQVEEPVHVRPAQHLNTI